MTYGIILRYMVTLYRCMGYYCLFYYTSIITNFVLYCNSLTAEVAQLKKMGKYLKRGYKEYIEELVIVIDIRVTSAINTHTKR